MTNGKRWAAVAGCLMLAGCRVNQTYVRPIAPAPAAFKEASAENLGDAWKTAQPGDEKDRGKWWERYNDPLLNQLEEKVAVSNQNVAAAAANVQAARAMIREARSRYLPTVGVAPAITNSRISTGLGRQLGVVYSAFSLPLEASWEPDLWGRVRNTVQVGTIGAQVSAADLANVKLSAQAELAANYYELRTQDALADLLSATIAAYREAVDLNRALLAAGLGNDEAVAQAEAQLKAAEAQATNLGVLRAQYEHAIATLSGQPPEALSIASHSELPGPPRIPVGVPSELLERRPDIAAAERAVAQANAQIGVAKTAFYPTVTLSAAAGLQGLSMTQWLQWPSRVWSLGPALAETIFDGGLRRATVQQYQATYDATVANYRQTVLTAFQQVEDSLAAMRILSDTIERQDSAVAAAARSLEVAETRYKAGLDPYLNVIAAQTALLNARESGVTYRAQRMVASVQLIKALGGGWDASHL